MKPKRPRIQPKIILPNVIEDELEFKENKCTPNARHIVNINLPIQLSIWFDKHYILRATLGSNDGEKRDGIGFVIIEEFIKTYFHHLFYYSSIIEKFKFLNHESEKDKGIRIMFKKTYLTDPPLNVSVEIHFANFNNYELTVKTAMCVEDFNYFDGQYILEIVGEDYSVLSRCVRGELKEIHNCQV